MNYIPFSISFNFRTYLKPHKSKIIPNKYYLYIINLHISLRFSSGDLSAECDEVDPQAIPVGTKPPPLQQQPLPQGGPPNMPPPPGKYTFLRYFLIFYE